MLFEIQMNNETIATFKGSVDCQTAANAISRIRSGDVVTGYRLPEGPFKACYAYNNGECREI